MALTFWPKFYLNLFGPTSSGRSMYQIIFDPEAGGIPNRKHTSKVKTIGIIKHLWSKFNVFLSYQVHGAYAHLGQRSDKQMSDSIEATTTTKLHFDDPLRLQVPYDYIRTQIPRPPDCFCARMVAILLIGSIYMPTII